MHRIMMGALVMASLPAAAFELYQDEQFSAAMRGYLGVHGVVGESDGHVQDGNSRIGLAFDAPVADWNVGFYGEWAVRAVSRDSRLTLRGDELGAEPSDSNDPFSLRQGKVSASHQRWGLVSGGKQWSVYYDVAGITDSFLVFGGDASGTYNFGGDGGLSGTGRADAALTWRFEPLSGLKIGLQTQSEPGDIDVDSERCDPALGSCSGSFERSYGASLKYRLPTLPLALGVAANLAQVELNWLGQRREVDDKAWVAAVSYGEAAMAEGLYLALLYGASQNHELDGAGRIFDSWGNELYLSYGWANGWSLYGGYNWLEADDDDYAAAITDPAARSYIKRYAAVGVNRIWTPRVWTYLELKVDDSDLNGEAGEDLAVLGVRLVL